MKLAILFFSAVCRFTMKLAILFCLLGLLGLSLAQFGPGGSAFGFPFFGGDDGFDDFFDDDFFGDDFFDDDFFGDDDWFDDRFD